MKIKVLPFKQEGVPMYVGVMNVKELLPITRVDEWRVGEDEHETGYQRNPETARVGKVAKFLQNDPKPLMPTSILVSCREGLAVTNNSDGVAEASIPETATFWIVDGQHRLYGLERAINELGITRLEDYPLPIVIVEFASYDDEANQFRIINETMKKMRTDLARRLLAMRLREQGPGLRKSLRETGRLWETMAVDIIKALTEDPNSPWYGRVQFPNMRKQAGQVVRELSFSTSLKPILSERPYRSWRADQIAEVLREYWDAWRELAPEAFDDPENYVIQKTPGAFSLHELAYYVLEVLRSRGINHPVKDDFKAILSDLGEDSRAEFWHRDNRDGAAIAGSMKGFGILADTLQEELQDAGHIID